MEKQKILKSQNVPVIVPIVFYTSQGDSHVTGWKNMLLASCQINISLRQKTVYCRSILHPRYSSVFAERHRLRHKSLSHYKTAYDRLTLTPRKQKNVILEELILCLRGNIHNPMKCCSEPLNLSPPPPVSSPSAPFFLVHNNRIWGSNFSLWSNKTIYTYKPTET